MKILDDLFCIFSSFLHEGTASSVRQIITQWLLSVSQNRTAGKVKDADQLVERSPSPAHTKACVMFLMLGFEPQCHRTVAAHASTPKVTAGKSEAAAAVGQTVIQETLSPNKRQKEGKHKLANTVVINYISTLVISGKVFCYLKIVKRELRCVHDENTRQGRAL